MVKADKVVTFAGRRVLVVGLGLHGGAVSAIRWLHRQGAKITVTDLKTRTQLAPSLKKLRGLPIIYHLGGHRPADIDQADVVYVNQGVPLDHSDVVQAGQRGLPIINETTIFFEHCPGPIIGVTGTRGKSTTTVLLGQMLARAKRPVVVAGNVRDTAMLDVLPRLKPTTLAVLELSSFQLDYLPSVERSPRVAIMTNLKIDHLNRYRTMEEYAQAKFNIFRWQHRHDTAVVNAANPWTRQAVVGTPATVWWFQTSGQYGRDGLTVKRGWVTEYHGSTSQRLFPVSDVHLVGQHNLENILAAAAAGRALGISPAILRQTVRTFSGLPNRQELVGTWRGHQFINDTTATTPDGTLAALAVFPKAVFIVGGTDKKLDYAPLAKKLLAKRQPLVFLPGSGTKKLLGVLRQVGDRRHHPITESMEQAVHQALAISKRGQPIVLSPGAASFGLFVHEFDRGEQFVRAIKKLR